MTRILNFIYSFLSKINCKFYNFTIGFINICFKATSKILWVIYRELSKYLGNKILLQKSKINSSNISNNDNLNQINRLNKIENKIDFLLSEVNYYTNDFGYCPICAEVKTFSKWKGLFSRYVSSCPTCLSIARHRFFYLYAKKYLDFTNKKILHVAPESALDSLFNKPGCKRLKTDYFADGYGGDDGLVKYGECEHMDIKDIRYPDNEFDFIICNMVLEHVDDDETALKELSRVLTKDGKCILNFPFTHILDETMFGYEFNVEMRTKILGWFDHHRLYGNDVIDKLKRFFSSVEIISPESVYSEEEIKIYSISDKEFYPVRESIFFICSK